MSRNEDEDMTPSVQQEYKDLVEIDDDDAAYVVFNLRIIRIFSEIGEISARYYDGEISAYEAMVRQKVLLEMSDKVYEDIKSKLLL
jgi:hypothetical protein